MSETHNETPTEPQVERTDTPPADLGESGKKALQAEREARKQAEKSAAELQARIDAIEAEKLSDLEKAQKAAADMQAAAEQAQREAMRYRLAATHGISHEDAELFLTGDTEEVMTAQAERLAARAPDTKTPKPDLTQGGGGGTPPALNSDALTDAIKAAVGAN